MGCSDSKPEVIQPVAEEPEPQTTTTTYAVAQPAMYVDPYAM